GIDERKALQHNPQFALFLVGILVFPLVQLKAAFHKQWAPLFEVLADHLGLAAIRLDIDKRDLLLGFASLGLPLPIYGQPEACDCGSFGGVFGLGIAGEIAG